jgi:hypothetical protein
MQHPTPLRPDPAGGFRARLLTVAASVAMALTLAACGGGSEATDTNDTGPLAVVPNDMVQALSGSGGGGGGGGGGGTTTPPANCAAQISSFNNTAGYGPYGPNVADIKTRFSVKNCTASAVNWKARLTYHGPFWGGTVFDFPLTCNMAIAANSTTTCQVTERYLMILQTYQVTLDVLDASGNLLDTAAASVATPTTPNPNAT